VEGYGGDAQPTGVGESQFEAWYTRVHGRLIMTLVRLGASYDDAADIAADTFSIALERWDRVRDFDSPEGWAYRVALNRLNRRARRRRLEEAVMSRQRAAPVSEPIAVWDAVRRLPARQRTAIILKYLLDLNYEEISGLMKVRPGTVAATLSKARRALAVELREEAHDE